MKKGDIRYSAYIDDETGKIEFTQHVLRTIREQYILPGRSSYKIKYTYWVQHIHGVTWVKLSTRNGDWGYDKNVPGLYVTRRMFNQGAPYSASEAGALLALKKAKQNYLKRFGEYEPDEDDDDDDDEDDEYTWLTIAEQLKRIATAQKRLRTLTVS